MESRKELRRMDDFEIIESLSHVSMKERIAYEREHMYPFVFTICYVVAPLYLLVSFALCAAFVILLDTDEVKYLVPGLLCIGTFVVITIALLVSVPFTRRKTVRLEMARYDFDTAPVAPQEVWDFSSKDYSLVFDRDGMRFNGCLYNYARLEKRLIMGHYCRRVNLYLRFTTDTGEKITLLVNPQTLKMLQCLDIRLDNQASLDYILSDTEAAFTMIHSRGYAVPK